jgi:hypothetical protein
VYSASLDFVARSGPATAGEPAGAEKE